MHSPARRLPHATASPRRSPAQRLERAWRILATALCFACFGLGGLVLRLVVFPLLSLFVRDPARRAHAARGVIHHAFRLFIGLMHRLGIYTYETHGLERLNRGGQLILANHPSLIDVVFLVALVRNADCVVKGPLANNPFTRGPVRAAGYICNDEGEGLIEACVASLRKGSDLIIFPEGTRTRPGEPLKLQRGAANIAVRGLRDITPVVIECDPPMLTKGVKWYRVPLTRPHFRFTVRDDIVARDFVDRPNGEALAARRLTEYLHGYFTREIGRHAGA